MSAGYNYQSSFATGEIDPAIWDRTNLERHRNALRTAENIYIGRTGRVISRQGTSYWNKPKYPDQGSVFYLPKATDYMLEMGVGYFRIHNLLTSVITEEFFPGYTEDDLPYLKFSSTRDFVYVYRLGRATVRIMLGPLNPLYPDHADRYVANPLGNLNFVLTGTSTITGSATGYDTQYVTTIFIDNEESIEKPIAFTTQPKLPISYTEKQEFNFVWVIPNSLVNRIKQAYIYRRPSQGNAYGFVGVADINSVAAPGPTTTNVTFKFVDYGLQADMTHLPPTLQEDFKKDLTPYTTGVPLLFMRSSVGIIFQDRHVINGSTRETENQVFASRNINLKNFYRDYPLDADSALAMKTTSIGRAKVLHFHDGGGLLAFTNGGIYGTPNGALVPQTAYFEKRGTQVIQEQIRPLEVPGAIFMMNATDDSLTGLVMSQEALGFQGQDLSIYNNHMFFKRRVIDWTFQGGAIPLIWIVLNDGSAIAMSYNYQEQLRAFCRIKTDGEFHQVMTHEKEDGSFDVYFTVYRSGQKIIEKLADRYVDTLRDYIGLDSSVTRSESIFALTGGTTFSVAPVTPGDWTGILTLTASSPILVNSPGEGAVGSVFRFFMSDNTSRDLTVTQFINSTTVRVEPDFEFPSGESTNLRGYYTFTTINGLGHLEGKKVGVLVDGFIEGSPLNSIEGYNEYVVTGGAITLAEGRRAAIAHVGLPYACSLETLDVVTVEQKPVIPESKLLTSVHVSLYNSRGVYISDVLPKDGTNENMEPTEQFEEDLVEPSLNGALLEPYTKRLEIGVAANWNSNGRIALRSVDPYPWELLSFISDIEIEFRSTGKGR